MRKAKIYMFASAAALAAMLLYLLISGERQAAAVRENVVRFHVVAHSDSEADQALKRTVRDGLFARLEELFAPCASRSDALEAARENAPRLQAEAEEILRAHGCDLPVRVAVGACYFPTKSYGDLHFPAGRYQAVNLYIGEAKGENFWCVLFPALCVAPAVESAHADEEMAALVGREGVSFLQQRGGGRQVRFYLVEWFEKMIEFF